ncbi:MAG: hydantoinase B/oxoprolinase family protein [Nitrososphaerales archaeon]|nr:hydantoinase B/oxoprolinase family protein [Nitrososphaerales archaeon]
MELRTKSDQFTLSIVRNALVSAAEEMFTVTARTAKSPIIYDVLDFSTAITDAAGRVTAQATGIPLFIGVFDYTVKGMMKKFPPESLSDGDVVLLNDPYMTGTHLNDVGVVAPVFWKDKLVAFSASKGHWLDVGGMAFGSWGPGRTEIYQEGIQMPPVKLFEAGRADRDIVDILKENSRMPSFLVGDMEAQVAGLRVASRRVKRIIEKYGLETYEETCHKILSDGEKQARSRLAGLPHGRFEANDFLDEGGKNDDPLPIHVKVDISDQKFLVDFSGNSPQLPFSLNTTYPATVAAVRVVYMAMIDPHARYNQGVVAPLEVVAPERTIFNALKPAPVSVYWEALTYAADLVWKALAPVSRDKLTAGHFLSVVAEIIAGVNDKTGEPFALVEPNAGGWGAGMDKDGESSLVSFADGETYTSSVEVIETRYPIMVDRYCLNTEDGVGHGKFRGGFGIIKDYRMLNSSAEFTTDVNRSKVVPWGIEGGKGGTSNYMVILRGGKEIDRVRKISSFKLTKDDIVSIRTGAGGGWGNPKERARELVLQDVREGLLTVQAAREAYPAQLRENPPTVDRDATARMRSSR